MKEKRFDRSEKKISKPRLTSTASTVGFGLFSSPGQSPGRAIVLAPASALALAAALALAKC